MHIVSSRPSRASGRSCRKAVGGGDITVKKSHLRKCCNLTFVSCVSVFQFFTFTNISERVIAGRTEHSTVVCSERPRGSERRDSARRTLNKAVSSPSMSMPLASHVSGMLHIGKVHAL